jgi:hypothetical protein
MWPSFGLRHIVAAAAAGGGGQCPNYLHNWASDASQLVLLLLLSLRLLLHAWHQSEG